MQDNKKEDLRKFFHDVIRDEGMRLSALNYGYIRGIPMRRERWTNDGVSGESVIFRNNDVANLSDHQLIVLIENEFGCAGPMTIKRGDRFVFANHSFKF